MKHLDLLKANNIQNTSTAVYHWIDSMPASSDENKWLKKTFDGLYQLEQDFVLDTAKHDNKETIEVMQKAELTSEAWVNQIIAIHDREEPAEEQAEIVLPAKVIELEPEKVELVELVEPAKTEAPSLTTLLEDHLESEPAKKISKHKLMEMGYKGKYPTATNTIFIEKQFKLKREKRTNALQFILSTC